MRADFDRPLDALGKDGIPDALVSTHRAFTATAAEMAGSK